MRQGAAKPIQFEYDNPLDLTGANRNHERFKARSGDFGPGQIVAVGDAVAPPASLAMGAKLMLLAHGGLFFSADADIECSLHVVVRKRPFVYVEFTGRK